MKRIYLTKPASFVDKGGNEHFAPSAGFYNFPADRAYELIAKKIAKHATDDNQIVEEDELEPPPPPEPVEEPTPIEEDEG